MAANSSHLELILNERETVEFEIEAPAEEQVRCLACRTRVAAAAAYRVRATIRARHADTILWRQTYFACSEACAETIYSERTWMPSMAGGPGGSTSGSMGEGA